ncbi:hypothetical protein WJX73_001143 [Symbiochloris irregularis]|uniref:Protein kinase domain-containing protein n=1 Tax=Symbiochloris irregularis TaxID=706552 RepID=A0AAW1PY69_9CHLO
MQPQPSIQELKAKSSPCNVEALKKCLEANNGNADKGEVSKLTLIYCQNVEPSLQDLASLLAALGQHLLGLSALLQAIAQPGCGPTLAKAVTKFHCESLVPATNDLTAGLYDPDDVEQLRSCLAATEASMESTGSTCNKRSLPVRSYMSGHSVKRQKLEEVDIVAKLLGPVPAVPAKADLHHFLGLKQKIPLLRYAHEQQPYLTFAAEGNLACHFTNMVSNGLLMGSEEYTLGNCIQLVEQTFLCLTKLVADHQKLRYKCGRSIKLSPERCLSSAAGSDAQLDWTCTVSHRGLAYAEERASSLTKALETLRAKLGPLHPRHYEGIDYLPAYAASGSALQFFSLDKAGQVEVASDEYDLSTPEGIREVIAAICRFYQLLCALALKLSPLAAWEAAVTENLYHQCESGQYMIERIKGEHRFTKYILKTELLARLGQLGCTLEQHTAAYPLGTTDNGIIRASVQRTGTGKAQRVVVKMPMLHGSVFNLPPRSAEEYNIVLRGACEGLHTLHSSGMVHRDVRLQNLLWVSEERKAVVLGDLDTVGPSGQTPVDHDFRWGPLTSGPSISALSSVGEYTCESDVHMLGKALLQLGSLMRDRPHGAYEELCKQLIKKSLSAGDALAISLDS